MIYINELIGQIENEVNGITLELNCYKYGYICDIISEIADQRTSIYYSDQREFYYNNVKLCENALLDYGYDLNELIKDGKTLDDIICMAGALGEYQELEGQLYSDYHEGVKLAILSYLRDIGIETITNEQYQIINEHADMCDHNDKLEDIIEEAIEELNINIDEEI